MAFNRIIEIRWLGQQKRLSFSYAEEAYLTLVRDNLRYVVARPL